LACLAGTVSAAPEDTFPREASRAVILRWLAGNSDLNPDTVVTMTDELVVAVTSREDGRGVGRSTRLSLREEVINPDAAAAWGGRSIQLDLDLDCGRHRAILGARRIYARPNLQGAVRITRSDNAWAEVPADTVIDDVARATCAPPGQFASAPPASDSTTVAAASASPSQTTAEAAPPRATAQVAAAAAEPAPAKAAPPDSGAKIAQIAEPEPLSSAAVPAQVAAAEPPPAKGELEPSAATVASSAPAVDAAPSPAPVQVAAADAPKIVFPPKAETAPVAAPPAEPSRAPSATTTVAILAPPPTSVVIVGAEHAAAPQAAPELQKAPGDQSVMVHNPFAEQAAAPQAPASPRPAARVASAAAVPLRPADYAVQIAAAPTADLAHDSWQALKAKLPSLVATKTFAVEPVLAKGRTLYRALLLGFDSPGEAAELCKALRSQSVDCILRQLK
jgi:hypothetical protein